jgi:hypothetical protein
MSNIKNFSIMKKQLFFAFISAFLLISAGVISSCSSSDSLADEPKVEDNPNFNPATNEVTTQFVFNVSNGNNASTRQSAVATQASSSLTTADFRGIDNSFVMCFKQNGDGKFVSTPITADKSFDMSTVVSQGSLDNAHSRRVLEMSLPLNTNSMMFYGRAINSSSEKSSYSTYGHLDEYKVVDDLSQVNFQLGRRLSASEKTAFLEIQKLLASALTCILNTNRGTTSIVATDMPEEGAHVYGFDLPASLMPNMRWGAYLIEDADKNPYSPIDNQPARPLEIKLYKAYKELTTIQEAEVRNASGYALKETTRNLWTIINSVRCAEPTNQPEALAKYMAQRIHEELQRYFNATVVVGGVVSNVTVKSAQQIIDGLTADGYWPASAGDKPSASSFGDIAEYTSVDLGKFPEQFDLPQGSTHIKFDNIKRMFYYVENYNSSAVGGETFTVDDYYYPAELLYFGNSPLRVSDKEHAVAEYPASVTAWNSEASTSWGSDWSVAHVQSSSRSVAMKNDINYGTSLLKLTVGYNVSDLKDNNKAIQQRDYGVEEDDKTITVQDNSFKLVGVVIGDQWPNVGWNFLPKTSVGRKGYIYDKVIPNNGVIPASTSETSEPNYTLVFDNYQDMTVATPADPTNKQSKVYVALEFQNNSGVDFFGKDNLVANGTNFYLIGELDPNSKTGPLFPTYHALPPYDKHANGDDTRTVPRVFIQDHMTTVNFKIGENSLKYAYLTVPDLRSSSVTLGLSVDLQWQTGLDFGSIILGGEE